MKLKIATFNMENLFARFDFAAFADEGARQYLPDIVNMFSDFNGLDQTTFDDFKTLMSAARVAQDDDKRQMSAQAIAQTDADIVCLQEIDDIHALARFRDFYLNKTAARRYPQLVLHEGNDRRGIDVAAMAVAGLPLYSRSHAWMQVADLGTQDERTALGEKYPMTARALRQDDGDVFKRDCLELELRWPEQSLTLFVCHFKSMGGGRERTAGIRQLEALGVRRIIEGKFADPAAANWMVIGDLNDYRRVTTVASIAQPDGSFREHVKELKQNSPSGLDPLLDDDFSINLMDRRARDNQWTHYYAPERHKTQLDYMLVSAALAERSPQPPAILRAGQPFRVPNTADVERYPRIGWDRPKASDHCPVVWEFELPV